MLASPLPENQIGHFQVRLSRVDSTNNYAANLLKSGKALSGTVILADEQTNGRGQRDTSWQSEPGMNLQFSIIWIPNGFGIQQQRFLNFAVSNALIDFLKKKNQPALIKWPNDILVLGKKIAGVLIENQIQGQDISSSIIGIGINVHQKDFGALPATSLSLLGADFQPLEEILRTFLFCLNEQMNHLTNQNFEELESAYFQNLFGFEKEIFFEWKEKTHAGKILGVDDHGKIQIAMKDEIRCFGIKEIKFLF